MNNKEIYIHVGMPKTGTTYIQRNIFPYFKNIYYLDLSNSWYSDIFRDFYYKNLLIFPFEKVREELNNFLINIEEDKILISDEAWFGGTNGGSHYNFSNNYYLTLLMKRLFPQAKVILTIRKQDKWLESMYKHLLRDGFYVGVDSFLNYKNGGFQNYTAYFRMGPNIDIRTLNYKAYIENYEKLFGKKNILIIPQELLYEEEQLFIEKICKFIDSTWFLNKEIKKHKSNSGYLYIGGILAKIFNRFFIFKGRNGGLFPVPNNKFLDFRSYLRVIDKIFPYRKSFISAEIRKKIMDYHSSENLIIDKKYDLNLKKYNYYV